MDVREAIARRRAYRSFLPAEITAELIDDLAGHAGLAPSCFNHQPWRFVFVYDPAVLQRMREALSAGNEWAYAASLMIAVMSRREDDCIIREREYHQFDTGMATAFLILRATELGLVAHPIAGYSPAKTREILHIPAEYAIITLVMVGRKSPEISPVLQDHQVAAEKERPPRLPLAEFVYRNVFPPSGDEHV